MRVLGIDLGEKRTGLAVSDEMGLTASGLMIIDNKSLGRSLNRISEVVLEHQVDKVVLGLPRNMDGSFGPQAKKAMEFARRLEEVLEVPVLLWDERLTTLAANKLLIDADVSRARRRQVIDKLAAVLILQSYLDSRCRTEHGQRGEK